MKKLLEGVSCVLPRAEATFKNVTTSALHLFFTLFFLTSIIILPDPAQADSNGYWTAMPNMATTRSSHVSVLLQNGKVLLAGGAQSDGVYVASAELFDPITGTTTSTGSMNVGRTSHRATVLQNGKVLVAGGVINNGTTLSSAELYDPATGVWTTTGSMASPRQGHTATLLSNGKVLVAAGHDGSSFLGSAELYDPATGSWSAAPSLAQPRAEHVTVMLQSGKVLVVAGATTGWARTTVSELYDPIANSWSSVPNPNTFRGSFAATLLQNGKVLITGGDINDGYNTRTNSAELFDPAANTWNAAASFATPRSAHGMVLLPNGKVLMTAGSQYNQTPLTSTEIYDPVANSWASTASMSAGGGYWTSLTMMANGRVLAAGGANGFSGYYANMAVFSPLSTIPIDDSHWNVIHKGPWSLTADGLQMNGSGMRVNNNLYSEDVYNFAGSEVFVKWQVNGAGTYMSSGPYVWVFPPATYGNNTTTNNSSGGSTVIPDNTWLYTRFIFPATTSGTVTAVVANGNYDNAGGTVVRTDTFPASTGLTGLIGAGLGDNYGSTSSYFVLGEVKTTAIVMPSATQAVYNFNDGNLPAGLGIPVSSVNSSQTLLVNPDSSAQTVTINAAGYSRISFAYSTDENTLDNWSGGYNRPLLKYDGVIQTDFSTSGSSQWRRLSFPITSGTQTVQIVTYPGYRLWLDDVTLSIESTGLPALTLVLTKSGSGTGSITSNPAGITCGAVCSASYNSGTTVTLTATPDSGNVFSGWSGACTNSTGTCQVTMDAAKNVTAMFSNVILYDDFNDGVLNRPGYTFTGNTVTEHDGILDLQNAVTDAGGGASLNFGTSLSNFKFEVRWFVHYANNYSNPQFVLMHGTDPGHPYLVSVVFDRHDDTGYNNNPLYHDVADVNTWSSAGAMFWDTTGVPSSSLVDRWLTTTVIVNTDTGRVQVDLDSDGVFEKDATYSHLIGRPADRVDFNPSGWWTGHYMNLDWLRVTNLTNSPSYTLTTTKSGSGTGSITSTPAGVTCGATCSASYNSGTTVTLTATPDSGSVFTGWSGACNGTSTCQVTMDAAKNVTAMFAATTWTDHFDDSVYTDRWTANFGGNYSITESGSDLHVTVDKAGGNCFGGSLDSITKFSGQNIIVETRVKNAGKGAFYLALKGSTSPSNFFVGINTDDVPYVEMGNNDNGNESGATPESSAPYLGVYSTFKIVKTGNQYEAYINGVKKGVTYTNNSIGDSNLSVAITNMACTWKSANFDNYYDYVTVTGATVPSTHTLTTTKSGNGTGSITSNPTGITCGVNCSASFNTGTTVTLTATPDSGSIFSGWSGACTNTTGDCQVTMDAAKSVTATFATKAVVGVWTTIAPMQTARTAQGVIPLDSNRLLVCGGWGNSGNLRSCEILNTVTNQWSAAADMNAERNSISMFALANGKILAFGGTVPGTDNAINTAELYDPVANSWQYTGSLQNGTLSHGAYQQGAVKLADGKILIAGGRPNYPWCDSSPATQIYDPATAQWTLAGNMNIARQVLNGSSSPVLLDTGKVLVVGGQLTENGCGPDQLPAKTELFDPATGQWTFTGDMSTARLAPSVVKLIDGKVLVCGGSSSGYGAGYVPLRSCEIYNPATGIWSTTGNMNNAGMRRTATLLPDGKVLVAGGSTDSTGGTPITASEIFDPATGLWTPTGSLNAARSNHPATLLNDNRVIVVGGHNSSGAVINSAEIFTFTAPTTYTLTTTKTGTGTGSVTSTPAGISCGADCSASFANESTVSLTANADNGSSFTGWAGCDSVSGIGNSVCTVNMESARNVTAFFVITPVNGVCGTANTTPAITAPLVSLCDKGTVSAIPINPGPWSWNCNGSNGGTVATCSAPIKTWSVTPSNTVNGSLSPNSVQTVNNGASTAFTVTPASGYTIDTVSGCSGTLNGATYTTGPVTADCTVSASFLLIPPAKTDGLCGAANNVIVASMPLTGLCAAGIVSAINGSGPWSWSCAGINGGAPANCIAPVQQYTLAIGITSGGSVAANSGTISWAGTNGTASYNAGAVVTLTASVATNNTFMGWGGDCSGSGTSTACSVTMNSAHSVTATFSQRPTVTFALPPTSTSITVPISQLTTDLLTGIEYCLSETSSYNACSWTVVKPVSYTFSNVPNGVATTRTLYAFARNAAGVSQGISSSVVITTAQPDVTLTLQKLNLGSSTLSKGGIVTSSPAGITCDKTCSSTFAWYPAGTPVTLTVEPAREYMVAWWENCSSFSGNQCQVTTQASMPTIKVRFASKEVTTLELTSSSLTTISAGGSYTVSGILKDSTDSGISGQDISITVSGTGLTATTLTTSTDSDGRWSLPLSLFAGKGNYTVSAKFAGDTSMMDSSSATATILVEKSMGYAIIIQGKKPDNEGNADYRSSTDTIRQRLLRRSLLPDNITYLTSDDTTAPTVEQVRIAITDWAKNRMNNSPAPLYIIMTDHGDTGGNFLMGTEVISPTLLNGWLNTLEGTLTTEARAETRYIIIGTCHSGKFIKTVSKLGRIVVASSSDDEESIRLSTINTKGGDFFLDQLFKYLENGVTMRDAFMSASDDVKKNDPRPGYYKNVKSYNRDSDTYDELWQHPLLDDDGNTKGTYNLASNRDGSSPAALALLGTGAIKVGAADRPADIKEKTATQYLQTTDSSYALWLKANIDSRVNDAWVEIRRPDSGITPSSGGTGQVLVNMITLPFTPDPANESWGATYTGFDVPGKYDIFYYTIDRLTGEVSTREHSVVYKDSADNIAPSSFNLVSPNNTMENSALILRWEASGDSDGPVTYRVEISNDNFATTIHAAEGINQQYYYVSPGVLLNQSTYSWRVIAVDLFGMRKLSNQAYTFSTLATGADAVYLEGVVLDSQYKPVRAYLSVTGTNNTTRVAVADVDGSYQITLGQAGTYTLTVEAAGFQTSSQSVTVVSQGRLTSAVQNVILSPDATPHTLNVTITGYGSGNVTSVPQVDNNISCVTGSTNNCSGTFTNGLSVSLLESTSVGSEFGGWTGDCSGLGVCQVSMNTARNVSARFNSLEWFRLKSVFTSGLYNPYYGTLSNAYSNAANGETIQIKGLPFNGAISLERQNTTVTLDGGYDNNWTKTGFTMFSGAMKIRNGKVIVKDIKIKP